MTVSESTVHQIFWCNIKKKEYPQLPVKKFRYSFLHKLGTAVKIVFFPRTLQPLQYIELEAHTRIQLSCVKPDVKEVCKKVELKLFLLNIPIGFHM